MKDTSFCSKYQRIISKIIKETQLNSIIKRVVTREGKVSAL